MAMCVVCPHGVWYACVIVCVSHDVADNLLFGIPILNVNDFQAKSVHGVCVCVYFGLGVGLQCCTQTLI